MHGVDVIKERTTAPIQAGPAITPQRMFGPQVIFTVNCSP
jgi:hypothetical protein